MWQIAKQYLSFVCGVRSPTLVELECRLQPYKAPKATKPWRFRCIAIPSCE